jgi:outer membrane protein assembly factor BamB
MKLSKRLAMYVCVAVSMTMAAGGCSILDPTETTASTDWPTYRHDSARSGVSGATLRPPLTRQWVFKARHAPQPAWDDPKPVAVEGIRERRRVHFDDVFQVVSDGKGVYFGSSSSNKVYALDARDGRIRWTVNTNGPVRLAPTLWRGRVLVGSDDGLVRCLYAEDGKPAWTFRAAPGKKLLLGNGRMISRWPVRTGVLVEDGIAYFGSGIFPAEGVFLYAVNAADGTLVWRNDGCGESPNSRISPQGYTLASESRLFVPMGRTAPAAFDRRDGRLLETPHFGKHIGGTFAVLDDGEVFTGTSEMMAFDEASGRARKAWLQGRKLVVTKNVIYLSDDHTLSAFNRAEYGKATLAYLNALNRRGGVIGQLKRLQRRKGKPSEIARLKKRLKAENELVTEARAELDGCRLWSFPIEECEELIKAGRALYAGTRDNVTAIDASTGRHLWAGRVEGAAKGLAVAGGRLYVSTDAGEITCFGPGPGSAVVVTESADMWPAGAAMRDAAKLILAQPGVGKGYCLVLGLETGQLAAELARGSKLMVYAVDPDAGKVARARTALDKAGLLGARVVVEQAPLSSVPYADYFANLIVSERTLLSGELPDASEVFRMLKPHGGMVMLGQGASVKTLTRATLDRWLKTPVLTGRKKMLPGGIWAKVTRGAVPGEGKWTHQYADAGNSACSDDLAVKAPFGLLWFGSPGPGEMMNRHRRAAAPLAMDGRMFVQGENVLMAYDAYNGVKLWEKRLSRMTNRRTPVIPRTNVSYEASNFIAAPDSLLMAIDDKCHRYNAATGKGVRTYRIPEDEKGQQGSWGYLAYDSGLVFGSRTRKYAVSDRLFALDLATGKRRWSYEGKAVRNSTISISGGRMYFVDSNVSEAEREIALKVRSDATAKLKGEKRKRAEAELAKADVRRVVALDTKTGSRAWEKVIDLSGCGGKVLSSICSDGTLLLFGVHLDGHYWKQFFAGQFDSRRVLAMNAKDGAELWSKTIGYRVRPLVIGRTLHAEPWAFDVRTGKQQTRLHPVTGKTEAWQFARSGHHCGCPVAAPNSLFFRSYNIAHYDLLGDYGTMHFGSIRTGCWVNVIPANGVVMVPEAGSGCMCPFPNMCTVVFKPKAKQRGWAMFSAPGPMTPVKRLAVNLGAPGDRKDDAGGLWLGHPRPFKGRLVMQTPLKHHVTKEGGRFFKHNLDLVTVKGTATSWLYGSGAIGLRWLSANLLAETDPPATYTVRLMFAEPKHTEPGKRVFDIRLQNRTVLKDFDIAEEAGGANVAVVKEFTGLDVTRALDIKLVPKIAAGGADTEPVLNAIELVRTYAFPGKIAAPSFEVRSGALRQTQHVIVTNESDRAFVGRLAAKAPAGLDVALSSASVRVAAKSAVRVPMTVTATDATPPGRHMIDLKLTVDGKRFSYQAQAAVRHYGNRRETVVRAVADTYAYEKRPEQVHGSAVSMLIDGGHHEMRDGTHAVAYLRFKLDVPGTPASARLRLHAPATEPSAASANAGRVCLVTGDWSEDTVTYKNRPALGKEVGTIGAVERGRTVEVRLNVSLTGRKTLDLALDPEIVDNAFFSSRESKHPPELIVEYIPAK